MIGPSKRIWLLLVSLSVMLVFGYADAQQPPQPGAQSQAGAPSQQGAQNPYLMGSEGYDKGPRGLTSYQPGRLRGDAGLPARAQA